MATPLPRRARAWAALALAAVAGGCATPIAPTGGPADTTPPTLVEASPADRATNVTSPTLTLTFSERLAPASATAVTVTPAGDVSPEVRVSAREIRVTLPELRDSTTYVVTVGTDLRDQQNVALREPITVAFATGDAIDAGRVAGVARDPATGAGAGGLAVWAYALADTAATPDPRAVAPGYRTETGADGAFRLDYLRPGPYFVAVVDDRNRNGRAEPAERSAAPPRAALVAADDTAAAAEPAAFWVALRDTIPPEALRVRPASDRRFSVRFSEPVRLLDATAGAWALADSASGRATALRPYQTASSPFEVSFEAADRLPATVHRLRFDAGPDVVADSAGLAPPPFALSFTPPARPDTLRARFDGFAPAASDSVVTLRPGARPGVRFTAPPPASVLATLAVAADGARRPAAFETTDGVTFRPDSAAALPALFALSVRVADSTFTQRFAVPDARETGGIVGRVDAPAPVFVEVRPESGEPTVVAAGADGAFVVDGLLPGPYTIRVWADLDGDGRWTGGSLAPYRAPEPLRLLAEPVQVRARWETEIDPVAL